MECEKEATDKDSSKAGPVIEKKAEQVQIAPQEEPPKSKEQSLQATTASMPSPLSDFKWETKNEEIQLQDL